MAFYFKIGSGIDQNMSLIANGVGVAHVDVAAQASAQQGVQAAVYGYDVVALPCQLAKQIRARHHRRAANH
ncbi:hypothetical protein I0600191H4_10210 [Collinsella sp. i06-0019-1H4]